MAKYSADTASALEMGGGAGFRLKSDNEKARVVFLYEGPSSIDGWAVHRFTKPNGATTVVDCPRSPKDPVDMCPACKAHAQLYTRIYVRMLNLATNEVTVWDRAASFRKDLTGFMEYFNPLYSKVYEITRRGSGLQTTYTYQSLNDSGLTKEQYEEYSARADEFASTLIRPSDSFENVYQDWLAAKEAAENEQVNVGQQAAPGAWGPAPGAAAPGNWGQAPQAPAPQAGGWGQAPAAPPAGNWGQAPTQAPPAAPAPQSAPPAGNWGQPPQGWGQNPQ